MLKPIVTRGLMLDFIRDEILCPAKINPNRVFQINDKLVQNSGDIVYLMSREFRVEDNWALIFASDLAKKHNKKLKIVITLEDKCYSKHQEPFLAEGLKTLKNNLTLNNIEFEVSDAELHSKHNRFYAVGQVCPTYCQNQSQDLNVTQYEKIPQNIGALVVDFNPINENTYAEINCAVFEVDSHNIIPARFVSDKQEFSAATLRRKIYANITDFLTEFTPVFKFTKGEAYEKLDDFIKNKLDFYSEGKNDPNKDVTSNLSPYLHFGFISAQRIAIEVVKSNASRENKETFLEELIVRKELADNFCLYNQNYKSLDAVPNWAKESLNSHRNDLRTYVYSLKEFEHAKTHDEFWNAIQLNLLTSGKIHGYVRMYWGKKILEWSKTPEEALKTAIYLNDQYALDGNDPDGYVGILWSIGGLHDRAFANRLVTGKIRYMSLKGCEKKFNLKEYIEKTQDYRQF